METSERWLTTGLRSIMSQGVLTPCEIFTARHGLRFLKAVAEISYFSKYGAYKTSSDYMIFIDNLVHTVVGDRAFCQLMRFNHNYSTLFLSLCDAGLNVLAQSPRVASNIMKIAEFYLDSSPERPPFRTLDLIYGLNNIGYSSDLLHWKYALSCGSTSSIKRVQKIDIHDAYALTHTIFYVTDFGRESYHENSDLLATIVFKLKQLSWQAEAVDNIDLLSEYVLCFGYLNLIDDEVRHFVDIIARKQRPSGCWDGPVPMNDALTELGIPKDLHEFYTNYHTTMLAWQAIKVESRERQKAPERKFLGRGVPLDPSPAFFGRALQELDDAILHQGAGIDLTFVIWFAHILGFGYGEIVDGIRNEIEHTEVDEESPGIRKLTLLIDYPNYLVREEVLGDFMSEEGLVDLRLQTPDDIWNFAILLSKCERVKRASLVCKHLSISHTTNKSIFVRLVVLGVVFKVLSDFEISVHAAEIESLYSYDGEFLWIAPHTLDTFHLNSGLLGKLLLHYFSDRNCRGRSPIRGTLG
jgi:hypothetical protein